MRGRRLCSCLAEKIFPAKASVLCFSSNLPCDAGITQIWPLEGDLSSQWTQSFSLVGQAAPPSLPAPGRLLTWASRGFMDERRSQTNCGTKRNRGNQTENHHSSKWEERGSWETERHCLVASFVWSRFIGAPKPARCLLAAAAWLGWLQNLEQQPLQAREGSRPGVSL